jgi:hypothetical protein
MAHIQVNVLREGKDFKYSHDGDQPTATDNFRTEVHRNDQITWRYWGSDQRVQISFKETSPFVAADGTSWLNETATFPTSPAIVHPKLDKGRLRKAIKYSVTLPDHPDKPTHDPEVIIVD